MKYLLIYLFVIISFSDFAQNDSQSILVSNDQFKISYTTENCIINKNLKPFEYGALTIVNKTDSALELGFNIVTYFEEGCNGCNGGDESQFFIQLKPNETYKASCSTENQSLFLINNPNFKDSWHFKSVKIEDLQILK